MNTPPLVIITTRLPPAICGIGTYSWLLRRYWPNEAARFLVVDATEPMEATERGDVVVAFGHRPDALARELDRIGPATLLLHYAGRAYHRFGFPFWLPRVLTSWRRRFTGARLSLFVHEVPGPLPFASRHFWLGELSKYVLRRLATSADVLITNTEHHATALRRISGRQDVVLIPIGSNIDSSSPAVAETRAGDEFVVFGLSFGRLQTLRLYAEHIRGWIASGVLRCLHLIGPADDVFAKDADALIAHYGGSDLVVRHGVLPSEQVARLLRTSGFALTNANAETWSKSGTFMACAANSCPVVIAASVHDVPLSFTVAADEVASISRAELETRAAKLKAWYDANADWPVTAAKVAALLRDGSPSA